jgi:hypothetical protein
MSLLPVPPLRHDNHDDDVIAALLRGDVEGAAAVLAAVEGLHGGETAGVAAALRDHDPASLAVTAIALLAVAVEPEPGHPARAGSA